MMKEPVNAKGRTWTKSSSFLLFYIVQVLLIQAVKSKDHGYLICPSCGILNLAGTLQIIQLYHFILYNEIGDSTVSHSPLKTPGLVRDTPVYKDKSSSLFYKEMKMLGFRECKRLAQGHAAGLWQSWEFGSRSHNTQSHALSNFFTQREFNLRIYYSIHTGFAKEKF